MDRKSLIVIAGPTASGKSSLALDLAERYGGEIICADSRTIYKGMDIGTAKPMAEDQARVPHHLLDVVEPGERYTVADFQRAAYEQIEQIRGRGKIPFLVGGTGLYIDSVVLEYSWPEQTAASQDRAILETKTIDELHAMIKKQHIDIPSNSRNKRHLISALTRGTSVGRSRLSPLVNTVVVAIATDKNVLNERIAERADEMFKSGVIEEAHALAEQYGWNSEAMKSNIYPIIKRLIDGDITQQEAIDLFVLKDRQLAKRQVTWLKRHDFVQWYSLDDAKTYLEQILAP